MPIMITAAQSTLRNASQLAAGLHDPATGETHFFRNMTDTTIIIGRRRACDIRVSDPELLVSREHAVVDLYRGVPIIRDGGSSNGTYVDGEDIHHPVLLAVGMRVQVGEAILVAVDGRGTFPIRARTIPEFCYIATKLYGNYRLAAKCVGKSFGFVWKHAQKWRKRRNRSSRRRTRRK